MASVTVLTADGRAAPADAPPTRRGRRPAPLLAVAGLAVAAIALLPLAYLTIRSSEVGLDRALALGVDSIEHGTAIGPQHWATLVERNLPVAPTLFINDVIAAGRAPSSPEASLKAQDVVAVRDAGFLAAGQAGVRFVLGTDANGVYVD